MNTINRDNLKKKHTNVIHLQLRLIILIWKTTTSRHHVFLFFFCLVDNNYWRIFLPKCVGTYKHPRSSIVDRWRRFFIILSSLFNYFSKSKYPSWEKREGIIWQMKFDYLETLEMSISPQTKPTSWFQSIETSK